MYHQLNIQQFYVLPTQKSVNLNFLEPFVPLQACKGSAHLFLFSCPIVNLNTILTN